MIGHAYNLTPQLHEGIREVLLGFDWNGTGVAKEFGPQGAVKFAAVSYKDDWAPVRDIRQSGAEIVTQMDGQ